MKKELMAWLFLLIWIVIGTSPVVYAYLTESQSEELSTESVEDVAVKETENCMEPKEEDAYYADIKFYDVPLSKELQMHLFQECDGYNIAPAIILAMIERESNFEASAKGDGGEALGLMQIQPKWHQETMDKLGCSDMLDPYQNITVGVAIVAQLKEQNSDLYWVLMAYNMGPRKATNRWEEWNFSDYAVEVAERASEIADEYESR